MTLPEFINAALSVVAIVISIYALKVAKRNDVQRIDYELAKSVLKSLDRLNNSFGFKAEDVLREIQGFEESTHDARLEWGCYFDTLIERMVTVSKLYWKKTINNESISDDLLDDLNKQSREITQFTSAKIKAYRGKMYAEREDW